MAARSAGLNPAKYFEAVEDRDCKVELVLPAEPVPRQSDRHKRQRPEPKVVVIEAASYMLKAASQKFRAAMDRWGGKLRIDVSGEEEVQLYRRLIDFILSHGKMLPCHDDPQAVHALLLLAREQGVEACVAACLNALLGQTDQLAAPACLSLLEVLDTGVSEHGEVQAVADELLSSTLSRTASLLREADVRGDADVQAALLALLGPLQDVLNDGRLRRPLFSALPFELLQDCVLADGSVQADTEATVLAAFCCWVESVPAGDQARRDTDERVAAILSRIRLPAISPPLLHCFWAQFAFLRRWDRDGQILLRATCAAADRSLLEAWQAAAADVGDEDENGNADQRAAAAFKAKCGCWWAPRQPALGGQLLSATFDVEVASPEQGSSFARSSKQYWGGCFWRVLIKKADDGVGAYLVPSMSWGKPAADAGKPALGLYSVEVAYSLEVCGRGKSGSVSGTDPFWPSEGRGWGNCLEDGGSAPTWEAFSAASSPWLDRDGVARARFTLKKPA